MLAKVFGQAIAEQTSLTGRSNKFAFDKLKLFNVIVGKYYLINFWLYNYDNLSINELN